MFKFTLSAGKNSTYILYPQQHLTIYVNPEESLVVLMGPLMPQEAAQELGSLDCAEGCEGGCNGH